jgi:hypothetical protein
MAYPAKGAKRRLTVANKMGFRDLRGALELIATAQVGSIRARRDPDLLRSFLAGTGLTI